MSEFKPKGFFIESTDQLETTGEYPCYLMHKRIHVLGKIKKAIAYTTAKGLYEFRVNGNRIGEEYFTPGFTNYKQRLQYQRNDVSEYLVEGENVVGFILGDGWYKGYINWNEKRNWYGEKRAAFLCLQLEYENGQVEYISSDEGFSWALSPILTSEIYHGEVYDARKEIDGWDTVEGFDNGDFKPVQLSEDEPEKLIPAENDCVKIVKRIKPQKIIKTPSGEVLIDFGQNLVGNVKIEITGKAGEVVHIKHGEILDKEGNFYCENIAPSKQEVVYYLKEGKNTYFPHFTFQCFRYVKLIEFPMEPKVEHFEAMVMSSYEEEKAEFSCSDGRINQLVENIKWSQRGNFFDIPIAGPQRTERVGWTGDAQIFAKTACYNMDTRKFFTKWLNDLKTEQFDNGAVPWIVPNVLGEEEYECLDFFEPKQKNPTSAAWGDAVLIIPWEMYVQYGDTNILSSMYQGMKSYVEYMRKSAGGEEIFEEGFHYGDWFAMDAGEGQFVGKTPKKFIATAYYAHSVKILSKTAKVLGREEDSIFYQQLFDKIKKRFQIDYTTENGLTINTQTACVLALWFELVEKEQQGVVAKQLVEYIHEANDHITTGFVGTGYICHTLVKHGYFPLAYKLLFNEDCPSWLYQVKQGATTIWEHWDGYKEDGTFWEPWMNSFNHYAYGCIGDFIYGKIAGINPDEEQPGYKQFTVAPYIPEQLEYANCTLDTVSGRIRSNWNKIGDQIVFDIEVPKECTAILIVNGKEETKRILKNGAHKINFAMEDIRR